MTAEATLAAAEAAAKLGWECEQGRLWVHYSRTRKEFWYRVRKPHVGWPDITREEALELIS